MVQRGAYRLTCLAAGLAILVAGCQSGANNQTAVANQQDLVSTEYEVVGAMLDLAGVGPDDLVADLGSGDGRIPIMAARDKGARGLGVEIDPDRIRQSNRNASSAGVAEKVTFRQQDLFATALSDVTVLTLFLVPEINLQLRPKILSQMRAGSRVVSNTWDMGDWRPDQRREIGGRTIFLWIVPAQVQGRWRLQVETGQAGELVLTQRYQDLSGTLAVDGRAVPIREAGISGNQIAFTADTGQGSTEYKGYVRDGGIDGIGWDATRIGD